MQIRSFSFILFFLFPLLFVTSVKAQDDYSTLKIKNAVVRAAIAELKKPNTTATHYRLLSVVENPKKRTLVGYPFDEGGKKVEDSYIMKFTILDKNTVYIPREDSYYVLFLDDLMILNYKNNVILTPIIYTASDKKDYVHYKVDYSNDKGKRLERFAAVTYLDPTPPAHYKRKK